MGSCSISSKDGAQFAHFKRDTIVAGIDVNDRGYKKLLVSFAVVYER